MTSGIYQITNTINGRRYIGSAKNLRNRWKEHRASLNMGAHHNRHLQRAWDKYGKQAFTFAKLLVCAPDDLLFYEQLCLDALEPEYNICRVAGSCLGTRRTTEQKQRLSEAKKAAIADDDTAHRAMTAKANARMRELYADPEWRAAWYVRHLEYTKEMSARFTLDGVTKTRREWADELGVSPSTLSHRVDNWGLDKALTTPGTDKNSVGSHRLRTLQAGKELYEYEGERRTVGEIATMLGVSRPALASYLKNHSLESAVAHYTAEKERVPAGNRSNTYITVGDETSSMAEWARVLNIGTAALYVRSSKTSPQDAVEFYVRRERALSPQQAKQEETARRMAGRKHVTHNGVTKSRREWARELGYNNLGSFHMAVHRANGDAERVVRERLAKMGRGHA